MRVIEYGCGLGVGDQSLGQLGDLVVTDIYKDPLLNLPPGVEFRIADIHQTDFKDDEFDVLVSNQVLEYLDVKKAFQEMKRIGKENAYYVFSVPTATWLILSISGQIFKKFENMYTKIKRRFRKVSERALNEPNRFSVVKTKHRSNRWLSKFAIRGHGYQPDFFKCLKSWRVGNWEKMLLSNGFVIVRRTPLLTYSSSNLPIIPTNRFLAKLVLSASYLFICKKSTQ